MFKLDNRLENDSFFMQEIKNFQIRLMNVQEFFWIVLIPIKPNLIELSDLEVDERNELLNFAIAVFFLVVNIHFEQSVTVIRLFLMIEFSFCATGIIILVHYCAIGTISHPLEPQPGPVHSVVVK